MHEAENPFIGIKRIILPEIDSTNNFARTLLDSVEKPENGTVIITHKQTKGIGQMGSLWESEPGKNITCSIILYPNFLTLETIFDLTKCISMAVIATLENYIDFERLKIKWPNDVLFENRKISGILIQNQWIGNQLESSIIGIGININQTSFSSAGNFAPISLKNITGKEHNLDQILEELIKKLSFFYEHLEETTKSYLSFLYSNSLFRNNEWASYCNNGTIFEGKIIQIHSDGHISLKLKDGEIKSFGYKEIEFVE